MKIHVWEIIFGFDSSVCYCMKQMMMHALQAHLSVDFQLVPRELLKQPYMSRICHLWCQPLPVSECIMQTCHIFGKKISESTLKRHSLVCLNSFPVPEDQRKVPGDENLDFVYHLQMVAHNEFLAKQDMVDLNSSEKRSLSRTA